MRALLFAIVAATTLAAVGGSAPAAGTVTTIGLPPKVRVESATVVDVDGDGRADLVAATSDRGRDFSRAIRVWRRRDERVCFPTEPDHVLDLTPDVVGFSVGDVLESPGSEIVLFTATGAFAWRPGAGERERPRKLATTDFLWQLPHPRETFHWTLGVRDLDGDGLVDLLLPEPGGYRVAFQSRADGGPSRFDRVQALRLPEDRRPAVGSMLAERRKSRERWRELRSSLSLGFSDRDEDAAALAVQDAVPGPAWLDWNGDGHVDLLALTADELLVWIQRKDGFDEKPDLRQAFPVAIDRGRRLDLSFGAHAGDLDGDGKADCVILAGDRRSEEARTQILVYVQGRTRNRKPRPASAPLFGEKGVPTDALFVGGFTGSTDLTDVDGDGRPDLVVGTVKVDAVDIMRAGTTGTLDASIYLYRNRDGRFSRRPDLALNVPLPTEEIGSAGRRLVARFLGDVSGNGVSDLLVRDREERIRLLAVRRTRDGLEIRDRPLFEIRIDDRADVLVVDGPAPEILVLEKTQIQHVRFR